MRKMIIFSDGGLGNRLNSLIGGLIAAKKLGCTPVICWPVNNWCGCSFEDLFVLNLEIIDKGINDIFLDDDKIYLTHDTQPGKVFNNKFDHSVESLNIIREMSQDIVYYHNKIPEYFLQDDIIKQLKTFKIASNILLQAKFFCEQHNIGKNIKGVHLRKTDHGRQIDSDQMFENILNDKKSGYFICSDDKDTEDKFNELKNVLVYPKTSYVEKLIDGGWTTKIKDSEGRIFPYNVDRSKQSVIEAFVDLLVLSRTNIIIRNKSSFLGWAKIYALVNDLDSFFQ
jgi:hypothetical protein